MSDRNALEYFDAGFTALVSVVPPEGRVSSSSKIKATDAGKVPGRKNHYGEYVGYNWLEHQPDRQEVHQWLLDGSNVGFGGWAYPAFDIDITDPVVALEAVEAVKRILGPCVVRTGRWPKVLVVCRSAVPLQSFDIYYERDHELLGLERYGIQFVANGRQYVMDGIHPVTGNPYTVEDPLHALDLLGPDALPELTPEKVIEVFDEIARCLTPLGFPPTREAEARVLAQETPQEGLKAPSMDTLRAAVAAIPNETPDRFEYVAVGYAIKGASQEDPETGREVFHEWCDRWTGGTNDPAQVDLDWDKMAPPYRTGYGWLIDKGRAWGADMAFADFGQGEPPPEKGEEGSASEETPIPVDPDFSDISLKDQFCRLYQDRLMVVPDLNEAVYAWTGETWAGHKDSMLHAKVQDFLKARAGQALELIEDAKQAASTAHSLKSYRTVSALVQLAKKDPRMAIPPDELDTDVDVLSTPAGPFDLRTGRAIEPDPRRRMVHCTSVAPDPFMPTPVFDKFMAEAVQGDPDFLTYMQTFLGYCLTGRTEEQVFPFITGPGGNGKSQLVKIVTHVMGSYATSVPVEVFQQRRSGGSDKSHEYQLGRMVGARLVVTSETKTGGYWDEQRVKQLTGEDLVDARMPYGRPFSFEMRASLLVVGNYFPELQSVGEAMARRMHIIPWTFKPAVVDKRLYEKLVREAPGILAWMMKGAQAWYNHGLMKCSAVQEETDTYLDEQDTLGAWLADCVEVNPHQAAQREGFASTEELHACYSRWKANHGGHALGLQKFGQLIASRLLSLGSRRYRKPGERTRGWVGITLEDVSVGPPNVVRFPGAEKPPVAGGPGGR